MCCLFLFNRKDKNCRMNSQLLSSMVQEMPCQTGVKHDNLKKEALYIWCRLLSRWGGGRKDIYTDGLEFTFCNSKMKAFLSLLHALISVQPCNMRQEGISSPIAQYSFRKKNKFKGIRWKKSKEIRLLQVSKHQHHFSTLFSKWSLEQKKKKKKWLLKAPTEKSCSNRSCKTFTS